MLNGIIELVRFAVITFIAAVAANVTVSMVAYVWGRVIRAQGEETMMRGRLARYARIATGLANRVEARRNSAAGAATHLFTAQRQEKVLRNRIRELENCPHRFVRLIGAEQFPNKPYEFLVMNTSVSHQVKRGEKHPFYDSSWAQPCPVHVWARGPEEAKAEFERVYPKASGFKVVFAQPLKGPGAGSDNPAEETMEPMAETEMETA